MMCRKVMTAKAIAKETEETIAGSVTPQLCQQRREAVGQEGFAHPAEAEAGQGDAELGGGEGGIEVLGGLEGELHAPAAGLGQGRSWLARTFTRANSAATKKPLASTSATMIRVSKVMPQNAFMA
jgi:hypothetical protein